MNKTITYSALSAIVAALIVLGGISLTDEKVYYCEDRNIVMQCDKLSAYYGLDNGKCWNEDVGNKLCRSGWLKVVNNFEQKDGPDLTPANGDYLCNPEGCVPI